MKTYKIVYTTLPNYRTLVNKNGSLKYHNSIKWVIIEATSPNFAIRDAQEECKFKIGQLISYNDVTGLNRSSY